MARTADVDTLKASNRREGGLLHRPWLGLALIPIGLLACTALFLATDSTSIERLAAENGPIETLTAILYGLAIIALLAAARREPAFFVGSAIVVGLMLMRELDLHRITSQSALALNSYKPGGMPMGERLIAGAIVLALAAVLIAHVIAYARRFLRGLAAGRPAAWSVAAVFLLLAWSASIDGLQRKARDFLGLDLPLAETKHFLGAFEEGMEVLIPLLILLAVAQALRAGERA